MIDTIEHPSTTTTPHIDSDVRLQEPGDHDRFSHYARRDDLNESLFTGDPVTALCGKRWTPNRDPQSFPVCKTCVEVLEQIPPGPPEDEEARRGR